MKTVIEILREAREWISVEDHWCAIFRWSPEGGNCALGALERVSGQKSDQQVEESIDLLAVASQSLDTKGIMFPGVMPWQAIALFNDYYGWGPTCGMFDLAIKYAQNEIDRQAKELVESCANMDALTPITARS